jgi:P-type conjugative transfer protein TrbG
VKIHLRLVHAALACALGILPLAANADNWTLDADGVARFPYGTMTPTLRCEPTFACMLVLQPGEVVYDKVAGDTVRWIIATGVLGPGGDTPVVYFKPTQPGLLTNFVITTDRRTYEVLLSSQPIGKHAPHTTRYGFTYPAIGAYSTTQSARLLEALAAPTATPQAQLTVQEMTGIDVDYKITGSAPFTPISAWNDGRHTYLRMPDRPYDAPAIYAYDQNSRSDVAIVVHPPVNNTYVLDGVPERIILTTQAISPGTCERNRNACASVQRAHR